MVLVHFEALIIVLFLRQIQLRVVIIVVLIHGHVGHSHWSRHLLRALLDRKPKFVQLRLTASSRLDRGYAHILQVCHHAVRLDRYPELFGVTPTPGVCPCICIASAWIASTACRAI